VTILDELLERVDRLATFFLLHHFQELTTARACGLPAHLVYGPQRVVGRDLLSVDHERLAEDALYRPTANAFSVGSTVVYPLLERRVPNLTLWVGCDGRVGPRSAVILSTRHQLASI